MKFRGIFRATPGFDPLSARAENASDVTAGSSIGRVYPRMIRHEILVSNGLIATNVPATCFYFLPRRDN